MWYSGGEVSTKSGGKAGPQRGDSLHPGDLQHGVQRAVKVFRSVEPLAVTNLLSRVKSSGWRVTVGPRTEMIHQTVGVEETLLGVEPLLGLQSDLDNIQGSHEERHDQGTGPRAQHLLGWIENIVSTSNFTLGRCHHSGVSFSSAFL